MNDPGDSAASDARDSEPAARADAGPDASLGQAARDTEGIGPAQSAGAPAAATSSAQRTSGAGIAADSASPDGASPDGAPPDGASPDGAPAEGESPGSDPGPQRAKRKGRRRSFWRELPILVAVALLLAVVIKTFAVQAFFIPSGSMENTLEINDRVLVNKIVYHTRPIHRGDIVVFNGDGSWAPGTVPTSENVFQQFAGGFASMFGFGHPGDILIKRVIGLPGDHVACCDAEGRVTVNGVPLNEQSYLYPGAAPSLIRFNIVVPPGRLWVMGDNRFLSDDSRDHMGDPGGGTIPESAVIGRAFVIIWPPSRWRFLPIPATFDQPALSKPNAAASGASPAGLLSARLEPAGPAIPLSLGFAAAVPVTWLQRRIRMRVIRRRRRDSPARPPRC